MLSTRRVQRSAADCSLTFAAVGRYECLYMFDAETLRPNVRYHVLALLAEHLGGGRLAVREQSAILKVLIIHLSVLDSSYDRIYL